MAYTIKFMDETMSGGEDDSSSSLEVVRTMKITPYTAIPECMLDLLGGIRVVNRRIIRTFPHRHPLFRQTRCKKVTTKPFDVLKANQTNVANYRGYFGNLKHNWIPYSNSAIVTATYGLPTLEEKDMQDSGGGDESTEMELASESWDYGGRNLTLPTKFMKWKSSGNLIRPQEANAAMAIPTIGVTVVRHRVFRKPVTAILLNMNKINKSSFRLVTDWFPPGTVRFEGLTATRRLTTARGIKFYELTYKFSIMPLFAMCAKDADANDGELKFVTWQRLFNPTTSLWEEVVWANDTSRKLFRYDEDDYSVTLGGKPVKGFAGLFHPLAV